MLILLFAGEQRYMPGKRKKKKKKKDDAEQ